MWYVYIYKSPAWHKESLMYEQWSSEYYATKTYITINCSAYFVYKFTIFFNIFCFFSISFASALSFV